MRIITLLFFISCSFFGYSQNLEFDDSFIPDSINYITIESPSRTISTKTFIVFGSCENCKITFSNMMDIEVINYLSMFGWTVVSQNVDLSRSTLMRREKEYKITK